MESRHRRLVAAIVLALSVLVVGYLLFFTPSETSIATPTSTLEVSGSPTISSTQTEYVANRSFTGLSRR